MTEIFFSVILFSISYVILYFLIKIGVRNGINESLLFTDEDRANLEKRIIDKNNR